MLYKYNKNFVANAQELRKNMTPEEKQLWYQFLKKLPLTVNRQKNIGDYIVDFFIAFFTTYTVYFCWLHSSLTVLYSSVSSVYTPSILDAYIS